MEGGSKRERVSKIQREGVRERERGVLPRFAQSESERCAKAERKFCICN